MLDDCKEEEVQCFLFQLWDRLSDGECFNEAVIHLSLEDGVALFARIRDDHCFCLEVFSRHLSEKMTSLFFLFLCRVEMQIYSCLSIRDIDGACRLLAKAHRTWPHKELWSWSDAER